MLTKANLIETKNGAKGAGSVSFWLQSAIDEREGPKGIFPPLNLSLPPMQKALHLARTGDKEEALKNISLSIADYANDVTVLRAYEGMLRSNNLAEKADEIVKHIQIVTGKQQLED